MKEKAFSDARDQAITLFHTQPPRAKDRISLDAIFMSIAMHGAVDDAERRAPIRPETRTGREAPPEEWFETTLAKLKKSAEKNVTIERFLLVAGRFPITRMDRINVARWLREAGHIPRKTGGNLIFDL